MEDSEHVSIEMEKLADSLRGKLDSLLPLSKQCSIYRVPERRRSLHPKHYTPQVIAIGPLHHGKEELKATEVHKLRYLNYFLQRTQVRMESFFAFIKEREPRLRFCYAENFHFESDEFVTMVLVDAIFLIELFLRYYSRSFRTDDDRIFGNPILLYEIDVDLLLLENQLPLSILNDLFNLAKTATRDDSYERFSFATIACYWFRSSALPLDEDLLVTKFSEAEHFLHLHILCLHPPSHMRSQKRLNDRNILGATELHQAGVKFEPMTSENLFDIRFNEGILKIPPLTIFGKTELLLRNLLAFESTHGNNNTCLNDYIILMSFLIGSPKDAELLIQNKVLELSENELVATVFNSLGHDVLLTEYDFLYSDVVGNLQAHCKKRRNKWKAALEQNYFNTPWASTGTDPGS